MKQFDIRNSSILNPSALDMANLFNLYSPGDGEFYFNINRTVFIKGMDNPLAGVYNQYMVQEGDQWTTIAFKFYNTIELWWIICKFNQVYDATAIPTPGTIIKIPTENVVQTVVNGLKEN